MRGAPTLSLVLCALILGVASDAQAKDPCLRYGPARATLTGRVFPMDDDGPDPTKTARQSFVALTLDPPVCVRGRRGLPDELHVGVVSLQGGGIDARMIGQVVEVTGRLGHAAGEDAPAAVLMQVTRIQPAKAAK